MYSKLCRLDSHRFTSGVYARGFQMILFYLVAHFNERVNAFGMLESAESGRLALPLSTPLMFNYHKFVVVFLFICSLLLFNFQLAHIRLWAWGAGVWGRGNGTQRVRACRASAWLTCVKLVCWFYNATIFQAKNHKWEVSVE